MTAALSAALVARTMRVLVPDPIRMTARRDAGRVRVTVPAATCRHSLGGPAWLAGWLTRQLDVAVTVTGPHMGRRDVRGQSGWYFITVDGAGQ